jgi:2,3-bisphosphoglycerate-independent phosphoglycerate mutase
MIDAEKGLESLIVNNIYLALVQLGNLKIIYVLLDGIGDLPHPDLEGLTPLEAARTKNIDLLARRGMMGEVLSVGKGIAPQSDIAVFNMLGYSFKGERYVGRGIIEIIGSNVEFKEGDLALRGNFATVDSSGIIIDRRAGRSIEKAEAADLSRFLEKNLKFSDPDLSVKIIPTIAHRVIVRLRHSKIALSSKITNTDPAYDKMNGIGIATETTDSMHVRKSLPEDNVNSSIISSKAVNEFTEKCVALTNGHPVNLNRIMQGKRPMNMILLRDPGTQIPSLKSIYERYGLQASCIVDMPVEIGIAKILGMQFITAGGIEDYEAKAQETLRLLDEFDLVYVHIKGPDEFGHDGNALGKKENIECIDRRYFGTLLNNEVLSNATIIISGDHSTPCIKKAHSDDPVPLLISGNSVSNDGSGRFTESFASRGKLGLLSGSEVLDTALKIIHEQGK